MSCKPEPGTPCVNKCFCADGYRRINGICFPEDMCDEIVPCNADETFECRKPDFSVQRIPIDDSPPCEYKCYCAPGLVNIDGQCVPVKKCSMPNTVYRTCVNPCKEPSCAHPMTAIINCDYACVDGCHCKEGYVKNYDGSCIEPYQCPKRMFVTNLLFRSIRIYCINDKLYSYSLSNYLS